MSDEELTAADLVPYTGHDAPEGTPRIIGVNYDVWNLRISLEFDDWDGMVYADFESPRGFRVLDEQDLQEMWEDRDQEEEAWLNVVDSGGWAALEDTREGLASPASDETEYLVIGADDCVSVLCEAEPKITVIEIDDL